MNRGSHNHSSSHLNSNRIISVFICVIRQKYLRRNSMNNLLRKMKSMYKANTLLWKRKSKIRSEVNESPHEDGNWLKEPIFRTWSVRRRWGEMRACWRWQNCWENEKLSGFYICLRANSENTTFVSRKKQENILLIENAICCIESNHINKYPG